MDPLFFGYILFKKTVVVAMIRLQRVILRPSFVRQEILHYWTTEGILVDIEQDSLLPCICDNTSSEATEETYRAVAEKSFLPCHFHVTVGQTFTASPLCLALPTSANSSSRPGLIYT